VAEPASTELTTPANSTRKPMTTVHRTASHVTRATSVPRLISTAQATANSRCARSRCTSGPLYSTSSSIAKEPNAAKLAIVTEWMTWVHSANSAGMTSAVRPARRVAARLGSWRRNQPSPARRAPTGPRG
jgi:hypothetical protein